MVGTRPYDIDYSRFMFAHVMIIISKNSTGTTSEQVHQTNSQHMAPQVWESSWVAAGSSSVGKGLDIRAAVASRSAF